MSWIGGRLLGENGILFLGTFAVRPDGHESYHQSIEWIPPRQTKSRKFCNNCGQVDRPLGYSPWIAIGPAGLDCHGCGAQSFGSVKLGWGV